MSLFEMAMKGGFLMIALLIISFAAIFIIIERYIKIRKSKKDEENFLEEIKSLLAQKKIDRAIRLCELKENSPISNVTLKGLETLNQPNYETREVIETAARTELRKLETNLGTLSTFAAIAPLIGFLGTVMGMVKVFMTIQKTGGGVDITLLAGGIWEAMITTIGGLTVGIIAILFYNYLVSKIEVIASDMEEKSNEIISQLRGITNENQFE